MQSFNMEVSKTVNKKRTAVGSVVVTTPLLADILPFVAAAAIDTKATEEAAKEKDFDGLPIYVSDEANWVFGAMLAAVKAGARNKLVSGTATLKDGLSIPTDWKELCAEGIRSGAAALENLRAVKASFAAYVATLGKTEGTTQTIINLFNNKTALMTQTEAMRTKMAKYVEDYAATLNEADMERFTKPIDSVLEVCATTVQVGDDF